MLNLMQIDENDLPENISVDGVQIPKDKFMFKNCLYVCDDSLIVVRNNVAYSNNDDIDENDYTSKDTEYELTKNDDGVVTITFKDPYVNTTIDTTQSTLISDSDMHTTVDKSVLKSKVPFNTDYKQSKITSKIRSHEQSMASNNDIENLVSKFMLNYTNKGNIKHTTEIDIDIDEDISLCVDSALNQGLKIKNTLINLIKINNDKKSLLRYIRVHNAYLNYNNTGDQSKIIKAKDLFNDNDVNEEMQYFIKNSTLTNITTVTGRLDAVINTLKDNMCVAICLQVPYFSISKAVVPGSWTKSIEYTFKTSNKTNKYKLYEMITNLTAEQIDNLRACAPVIAFIMSTNKMSKFYTDKKVFERQANTVMINPVYFIDACIQNINGSNSHVVIARIKANINKTLDCLNNVTKEQFDEINKYKAIVLKNTKLADSNRGYFNINFNS